MLKKIFWLIVFLVLVPGVFAQIEVERSIQGNVLPGGNTEIQILINLNGQEPSSIIITEKIPVEWKITKSNPPATKFEGKAKWLLYGEQLKENTVITYTLKSPSGFKGTQELKGNWKTIGEQSPINGDSFLIAKSPKTSPKKEAEKEKIEAPADYTLFIIAGVTILIIIVVTVVFTKKKKKKLH